MNAADASCLCPQEQNCALALENENQREQYERCLDEVSHVAAAGAAGTALGTSCWGRKSASQQRESTPHRFSYEEAIHPSTA